MKKFNIRVYGLLLNDKNEILVLDETRNGFSFTKFPGGGLEWGEGFQECLKREFHEELALDIKVGEIFYINEHFVQSAFNNDDQLISIYYKVSIQANNLIEAISNFEIPRWLNILESEFTIFTFPIDQLVFQKLKSEI
jgi:8-oxo-dGTP diphosphatase